MLSEKLIYFLRVYFHLARTTWKAAVLVGLSLTVPLIQVRKRIDIFELFAVIFSSFVNFEMVFLDEEIIKLKDSKKIKKL